MSAEIALLSAALAAPERCFDLAIEPSDFGNKGLGEVYAAVRSLLADGKPVDAITVSRRMGDGADARKLVSDVMAASGSPANIQAYAAEIKRDSKCRQLGAIASRVVGQARERGADPDAIVASLTTDLVDLSRTTQGHEYDMQELMSAVIDDLHRAFEARESGRSPGVPFGIRKLDGLLGGMHPTHLLVVGARPKMGKTAFLASVAMNAARQGYRVGIASAEMSGKELAKRLVASVTGVSVTRMLNGDLTQDEMDAITKGMGELSKLPIRIMDQPGCRVGDVLRQARAWSVQGGVDLIAIDYLQRIRPDGKSERRDLEVGAMAESCKTLAKSLDIPVMLLAQLSRDLERRPDKRPMASDFRDSGVIEQEADQILMLYRDCVYNDEADQKDAEVLIEANRHGPVGVVHLKFDGPRMLWMDQEIPDYEGRYL